MGRAAAVPAAPPPATSSTSRQEDITALKDAAAKLRSQLAEVMERLDRLEEEG
jgi:predicted  nucleic acid-binding Zn-ribbon protein